MNYQKNSRQFSVAQIMLWIFVIMMGIEIGAGLFEAIVIVPIWASAPPDSVLAYYQHNAANSQFALDSGRKFWMFSTPLVGLLAILTLLTGLKAPSEHRKWRAAGSVIVIILVIFTFVWFVPTLIKLTGRGVTQLSSEQVVSLTNWWVRLNWVRAVAYVVAWLTALRALTTPGVIK